MRGLSVKLADELSVDDEQLKVKLEQLAQSLKVTLRLDPLRNTFYLSQPEGEALDNYLRIVFDWMAKEEISFNQFATGEPNLEEVFLALLKSEGEAP